MTLTIVKKSLNYFQFKKFKIQYLPHLWSKMTKAHSRNPTHQGLSNNTKKLQKISYKNKFEICSNFSNKIVQYSIGNSCTEG